MDELVSVQKTERYEKLSTVKNDAIEAQPYVSSELVESLSKV